MLEIELETNNSGLLVKNKLDRRSCTKSILFTCMPGEFRDLCLDGEDLLILAGPTMDLDGRLGLPVAKWR